MSLLTDIEKAATTSTEPLSDLLRRCKVLAARLKHAEFAPWVTNELNGYENDDELPTYRAVATPISKGSFVGSFGRQALNIPVPLFNLPDEIRAMLVRTEFRQSIGALQELAKNDKELRRQWDPSIVSVYGGRFYEDMVLVSAGVILSPGTIVGILDTVRSLPLVPMRRSSRSLGRQKRSRPSTKSRWQPRRRASIPRQSRRGRGP